MIGRRVASLEEIRQPGDYAAPIIMSSAAGNEMTCVFMGPACDHLGRVAFPPHTCRECPDGSLEIRASILCYAHGECSSWHGYLDQGHVWRQV